MTGDRLSVCYVVPGHDLSLSSGPTRNVLSLARALGQWADVTVAFRQQFDALPDERVRVLEIQPRNRCAGADDSAMRGIGYAEFFRYLGTLRQFAVETLPRYDVVMEKSWLVSGYLSSICGARGQLGVPVENIVPDPAYASGTDVLKRARIHVGRWLAGRYVRRAPLVIAETEFLKREIAVHWRVSSDRIAVVDLGVDRTLFQPLEREPARAALGIASDRLVLVYVGVLDRTHDLEPAIVAASRLEDKPVELHIVGDGNRREEYEDLAVRTSSPVVFHGKVEHERVPQYIAAANLCLAPYQAKAFSSGELGYSTMKIPEYLAAGRPVVSVPSGRIRSLVRHGETGFLFANEMDDWAAFLSNPPSVAELDRMGEAASKTSLPSWDDTAQAYLSLFRRLLGQYEPLELTDARMRS